MKLPTTLFILLLSTLGSARKAPNSVLLSQVKSLTLYDNKQTSHRRVSAIPQLKCIGGNAKGLYNVDVMRCKNSGSEYDSEDIQWTCTASLPPEFKLGSTDVICEGYDSPDDPYILKGSCGVQYRLMLTDLGEQKFGKNGRKVRTKQRDDGGEGESIAGDVFTVLFWIAFVGIAILIVSKILTPLFGGGTRGNPRWPGFGGGGGWGGGGPDDPPPPYTPRHPKSSSSYRANSSRASSSSSNAGGWRPGFWSGAATGAAAAYALGNRNNNRGQRAYERYAEPQAGPSNWFGGRSNNVGSRARTSPDSNSSHSSSRYESTGFGGTSRR